MKAVEYTRYGPPDVLQVVERERPAPTAKQVLIEVVATTVTAAECGMRRGEPRWGRAIIGFTGPRRSRRRLGLELSGRIAAVGGEVTRFQPGDEVFGFTGFGLGSNAEYLCMPESGSLSLKPVNKTFEESAAAVDGASTALFFLKDKGRIQPGQRVLVIGAAGSIGTYAVQLAKHFGATVTGVCGSRNAELVRSLGADETIDYAVEDFTRNGETYDIIFDTVGRSSFPRCRGSLTSSGVYLPTTGLVNNVYALWTSITGGRRVRTGFSVEKNAALAFLKELIEADGLRIVIDGSYPLARIAEAHRHVETGHKRGNVVITVA